MSDDPHLSLKKLSLQVLIGSVAVSALLGIFAILSGDFGWIEVRILLTTLTVSAASLCCLSCGALIEARGTRGLPHAGVGLSLVAALLVVGGIWTESDSEFLWKTAVTTATFAVATAHVSLLLLARLAPRFAWARWAAFLVVYGVAAVVTAMVVFEVHDEWMFRLLGVLAILDAAVTIVVPVLHRLSSDDMANADEAVAAIDAEIERLRGRIDELERRRARIAGGDAPPEPNA